jgi:transcription initiation factor TFIIIB Brf1 subunit/transcription initiation factor TFIIB
VISREGEGHTQSFVRDISERKQAEAALQERLAELERVNRLMVGRENKMIKLKQEINELCVRLNLPKRYTTPDRIA